MENLGCPDDWFPLLGFAGQTQRKGQADAVGTTAAAGVAGRRRRTPSNRLRGAILDLCGVYSFAFSFPKDSHKAVGPFTHDWWEGVLDGC